MTAVKKQRKSVKPNQMLEKRRAILMLDGPRYIAFKIHSRDGSYNHLVTIRKNDLYTTCNCTAKDFGKACWAQAKALSSYAYRVREQISA